MAADVHSPSAEELMEYLDGEGSAPSRTSIETHVASCLTCQARVAEHRQLSRSLSDWQVEPAPSTLQAPAPREQRNGAAGAWRRWRPTAVMALPAAAAVVFVVVVTQRHQPVATGRFATPELTARDVNGPARMGRGSAGIAGKTEAHRLAGGGGGRPADAVDAVSAGGLAAQPAAATPRALIRTATLQIIAADFGRIRSAVERIVEGASGFSDQLSVSADPGSARVLRATLRVPGDRLAETLNRLRALGQVTQDQQNAQDVADQIVDLEARLKNARATEQRLTDLLRERTGKLSDVLEVEQELGRVRLEIEQLDAQRTNMNRRVSYAAIDVTITEERKAGLTPGSLPLSTQLRVAFADGLQNLVDTLVSVVLFALRTVPSLVVWGAAGLIGWWTLNRVRRYLHSA